MNRLIIISNCKNCGYSIEDAKFYSNCGAKKITKRITFKNLITEVTEVSLNIDNTFLEPLKT